MITLLTGLPGNAKTLYALNWVKAKAEKENRPVFYYGITILDPVALPWTELTNAEDWHKCPVGSIIVIDEAQKIFRLRSNGAAVPEHVSKLETHRHLGVDLVIITQHPMLIDSNVRRLCGQHFHAVRAFGTHKSTIHEFSEVREQVGKNRNGSIRHDFIFPKQSFSWYKSAELHTHKRNIPMRVYFLFALPFIVIALGYFVYLRMTSLSSREQQSKVTASQTGVRSTNDEEGRVGHRNDVEWLAVQRPRIVGLPHTAPQYDGLAKVATMPLPTACVSMGARCECFTSQGTKIANVQETICRDIVANGWFNPYRHDGAGDASKSVDRESSPVVKQGAKAGA